MTRAEWIADRADVLREVAAIERDLRRVERQFGRCADAEDVRQRLHAVRAVVRTQLSAQMTFLCGDDDGWVRLFSDN